MNHDMAVNLVETLGTEDNMTKYGLVSLYMLCSAIKMQQARRVRGKVYRWLLTESR
jgi:hypothetical protein